MSKVYWMALNIGDYMADTPHFSAAEHGAYLLLLMFYMKNGGLPKDETHIRKISKLSAPAWKRSRDLLRSKFGDSWSHKRCELELRKALKSLGRNSKSPPHTTDTDKKEVEKSPTGIFSTSQYLAQGKQNEPRDGFTKATPRARTTEGGNGKAKATGNGQDTGQRKNGPDQPLKLRPPDELARWRRWKEMGR